MTPALYSWLGGKGANLARLEAWGQPVPTWYGVTTAAFERCLEAGGLRDRIERCLAGVDRGSPGEVGRASREIQAWIRGLRPSSEVLSALRRVHEATIPPGQPVAVRSSASDEDGGKASFAGLHDSVLGLVGFEAVTTAVRTVWASAFSEAALTYRFARELPWTGVAMAIVVQQMVRADVSGVLFTCHPVTGDPHQIVISSTYGLGPGVVDGDLPADRFVVEKETLAWRSELATKATALSLSEDGQPGETEEIAVVPELQERSSLGEEQVRSLARAGAEIERRMGRPQDVEFAIDPDGAVSILQSRPVPTAGDYGPAAGGRCLWGLSGSTENHPGANLPMTYSVVRRLHRFSYHWFAETMRIPPGKAREWEIVLDSSLGYIEGHICSNRLKRSQVFRLIPGIDFHRRALFRILRVRADEVDPEGRAVAPGPVRRWGVELPKLLKTLGGVAWDAMRVRSRVDRLLDEAARFYRRCEAMEFSEMRPHELVSLYEETERTLARRWKVPLQSDLLLRFLYVTLRYCCRTWCGDRRGSLPAELVRGGGGSRSAESMRELMELVTVARADPDLRDLISGNSPRDVLRELRRGSRFESFVEALEGYLDRFSHKGFTEMKLEEPSFGDRPDLVIGLVRTHLKRDPKVESPDGERSWAGEEPERRALEALGGSVLAAPRRFVLRRLVRAVRLRDRQREEVKAARVRLMGLIRKLVRALGEELAQESILAEPEDVFYLTLEEVFDYVRGNAVTVDLRGLAALRRAQVERWRQGAGVDERFETYGPVYHRNTFRRQHDEEAGEHESDGAVLRGQGCCRGKVSGRVRKVDSMSQPGELRGEILALERIHTGWIPFLPSVSGLLVERGEILSHCSNVARELGIPTVVGVPGLMQRLGGGDRVTVDGEKGTVDVIERTDPLPAESAEETAT